MSNEITIDLDRARKLTRQVVDEFGADYVYQDHFLVSFTNEDGEYEQASDTFHGVACRYEFQGKPCCLVAQVLAKAGVTTEELRAMDQCDGSSFHVVELPDRLTVSPEARKYLREAQWHQDNHHPWGRALSGAEEEIF